MHGQQQRIAAIRALIGQPEHIIADEPTSALDPEATTLFMRPTKTTRFNPQARAVVVVSHNPSIIPLFDRVITTGMAMIRIVMAAIRSRVVPTMLVIIALTTSMALLPTVDRTTAGNKERVQSRVLAAWIWCLDREVVGSNWFFTPYFILVDFNQQHHNKRRLGYRDAIRSLNGLFRLRLETVTGAFG